jgi:four helix bundle protein
VIVRSRPRQGQDVKVHVAVKVNVNVDAQHNVHVAPPQRPATIVRYLEVLSFQRLDVYQRAIELLALVGEIVDDLPRGHAERTDQLIRATESVVLNIAEGAGRWSIQDSAKHYKIARGEAMECAASLDVMRLRRLLTSERYDRGIRLLESIVAMLTKMVR